MEPLLKVVNLSKNFGTLTAVHNVGFNVFPGEVVGLVGRSSAGKTVIAMMLSGAYSSDSGEIHFNQQPLTWPFQSRAIGIETIYNRPNLVEQLDITRNVFLGRELCWKMLGMNIPNRRQMDKEAASILQNLDFKLTSVREKVSALSSEQRQIVAIAQVMVQPAKLIIVDVPTDSLNFDNQQKLLSLIHTWQKQGVAVIFCSQDLDHQFAVSDRLIVLRQGKLVTEYQTDEINREQIVADLIGTTTEQQHFTPAIWALDNYYQARNEARNLEKKQMLLENDLAAQDTLNQQLIEQLAEQVKALDQANLALQNAQRHLLSEREEERKHLARELHDQLIQDLLGLNYRLEEINTDKELKPRLSTELQHVSVDLRLHIDDLRRICRNLRPPTIDNLGLGVALQSYCSDWSKRTHISVNLFLDPNLGRLPEVIELSIFRIVQEGLNNVWKHANAADVEISLNHISPRALMISIADDGKGLDKGFDLSTLSVNGHFGLLGISERVALLGGRLKLNNQEGGGLMIQVEIPHPRVDISSN